jgi:anaerobic selenocysteine-containing dehydrogenase
VKEVKTVCHRDCPDSCFVDVTVEEDRIISTRGSTENPVTQGFLCPRGMGDSKRVYSEARVLNPYVKTDGKTRGSFKQVSWKEATQMVAKKLQEVIGQHGNESILFLNYSGNQGLLAQQYPERLWNFLGATKHDHALCSTSGHEGICLHYGLSYGLQPEDLLDMKVVTYWGYNAKVGSSHQWTLSLKARKNNGTKIITIDPRKSPTAEDSDVWLNPRPGSDVALAYGIARYLIEKDYANKNFIDQWTVGYDRFKEVALNWTPERVQRVTGIDWERIEEVGDIYAEKRPSAFMIGLGLNKSLHGAESTRAVSLLPTLLGCHRGFHYSNNRGRSIDSAYLNGDKFTSKKPRIVSQVALGPMLKEGEFKFVFISGMNPAVTLPNQNAVRTGLSRSDVFVVVHETHWTETAKIADVVLPAPTYLEKTDFVFSDHHRYCRLSNKAIEPLGESIDEVSLVHKLARQLGLKADWLYEDSWEALRKSLTNAFENGSVDDLFNGKVMKLKSRPMNEYQTPSGKVELYSSKAVDMGLHPLPEQLPIKQSEEGWFILLNSSLPNYTHSQFTDVYGPIPQIVWINPEDSKNLEIEENEALQVYNDLGKVTLRATVTDRVSLGVLWAPRPVTGIDGNPMNSLTSSTPQIIGRGPTFNTTKVKLRRIKQK